jgi:hypothetical protein
VPADKLILLSRHIEEKFLRLAKNQPPSGRYSNFVDLQKTEFRYPVKLYCGGRFDERNKIEFVGVAKLGLSETSRIVESICGYSFFATIHRIDWAVDIMDISAWQFGLSCKIPHVQTSKFYKNRSGVSFYPHASRERTLLIYDRLSYLRSRHDPRAEHYK